MTGLSRYRITVDLATRHHYMKAMGIPVWMPRDFAGGDDLQDTALTGTAEQPPQTAPAEPGATHNNSASPAQSAMSMLSAQTASQQQKQTPPPTTVTTETPIKQVDCSQMNWAQLAEQVQQCQLCQLHQSRTQTVFGTGNTDADWMIIGEAPGAEEDRQGQPFVGRAGKLLNNMLLAIGLPREAVYIANVLKCRPPNNRDPKPEESAQCRAYLERQIALVNPKVILVVGRIAAHNLLQVNTALGRLRNQVHRLPDSDIPVIVTYHPAYLLRQPADKRKAWQDLQLARQFLTTQTQH